ncbi:peptide MFS transporter [Streptosporangium sp. KLBMP 9127]|nr:peptide MFS transporter [Streptosporangium sp. KLBMP 9127]
MRMPSLVSMYRQPRWFRTLFLTDIWERFSFFGMMAILFLFATESVERGGLSMPTGTAGAMVGVYISLTFVAAIPGGWLGDRVLGQQRAILWGAVTIAAGHCCMAVPGTGEVTFYLGILLIAMGTGLLKPNLSALLASFYPREATADREAGFSLFFMSIQISAMIAPFVTGTLGEGINWHLGFGAAAVGMAVGVLGYLRGMSAFGETGKTAPLPLPRGALSLFAVRASLVTGAAALLVGVDAYAGGAVVEHVVIVLGIITLALPFYCFRRVIATAGDRILAYRWVFAATAMLFLLLGQAHSVLNHFALTHTDRLIGGFTVPASWFQALHALFILVAAPMFARLWSGHGAGWSAPAKIAGGLAVASASFVVMTVAALAATAGPVSPLWLAAVYFLQANAELAVGTVALGVTAQIAPHGQAGRMMGLWWLAGAMGAAIGGQLARFGIAPGDTRPGYFLALVLVSLALAITIHTRREGIAARLRTEPVRDAA